MWQKVVKKGKSRARLGKKEKGAICDIGSCFGKVKCDGCDLYRTVSAVSSQRTDWLKIYCFHSSTFDNSFGTVPNSFEVNKKLSKSMEGRATT